MLTLTVQISAADKKLLEDAATIATDAEENKRKEKWKALVVSERARTIDQIKRLYAVVMGFGVTTCIANAYISARHVAPFSYDSYSILIAEVFSFVSLAALFYLGAERMLDRKYLQPSSAIPKWNSLWFDLGTLGFAAAWFVILANTFPTFPPSQSTQSNGHLVITAAAVATDFDYFIINLGILYLLDVVLLAIHGWNGWNATEKEEKERWSAYSTWITINSVSLILINILYWLVPYHYTVPLLRLNLGACLLIGWHFFRFIWDFRKTFKFYYPTQDQEKVPEEFLG